MKRLALLAAALLAFIPPVHAEELSAKDSDKYYSCVDSYIDTHAAFDTTPDKQFYRVVDKAFSSCRPILKRYSRNYAATVEENYGESISDARCQHSDKWC